MFKEAYLKHYYFVPERRLATKKLTENVQEAKKEATKAAVIGTMVIGISGGCINARTKTSTNYVPKQGYTRSLEMEQDNRKVHKLPERKEKAVLKPQVSFDSMEIRLKELTSDEVSGDEQQEPEDLEDTIITSDIEENVKDTEDYNQVVVQQPSDSVEKNNVDKGSSQVFVADSESLELFTISKANNWTYKPTEKELEYLYKLVYAEASDQGSIGQTMVANVVLNRVRNGEFGGDNIIAVGNAPKQFSPVKNGVPSVWNGKRWVAVTNDMISDSLKEAVNLAFEQDLTVELLKKAAEAKGITDEKYWKKGALFFWAPSLCSDKALQERNGIVVSYQWNGHAFCRVWNK